MLKEAQYEESTQEELERQFPLNHIYIWMCLHILDEFLLSYTKIGLKWMLKYIIRILMSLNMCGCTLVVKRIFTQQNNMKHSATLLKMLHTCKNGLRTQHIDRRIT
ncbi:hypothetical protein GQX74_007409 [Glossina fuscipes]|nr:hypothetical protein GQX74_007409 [Glossina fuscipes]